MEFIIQQNATLPILKMDVVFDGKSDAFKNFYGVLDNATIRFSMVSEDNGIQKIFMQNAYLTEKTRTHIDSPREYYIYYKWNSKDTRKTGRYVGQFSVILENGELIAPIRENIFIDII